VFAASLHPQPPPWPCVPAPSGTLRPKPPGGAAPCIPSLNRAEQLRAASRPRLSWKPIPSPVAAGGPVLAQICGRSSQPWLRAVLVLIATPPGKTESRQRRRTSSFIPDPVADSAGRFTKSSTTTTGDTENARQFCYRLSSRQLLMVFGVATIQG
jgi:hypothetical protein